MAYRKDERPRDQLGNGNSLKMAINPNITNYQQSEGQIKNFGPNDQRRLSKTATGVRRWISIKTDSGVKAAPVSVKNSSPGISSSQSKQNNAPLKLSNDQNNNIDQYIKDNPFLDSVTLQDIDDTWYLEMQKIKNDKEWYENEITELQNKLKIAADSQTITQLRTNINKFKKVINSDAREKILNLQRISYEYYRLYYTIESIKETEPSFDYESFITGKTLDDLENYSEELKQNA